MRKQIRRALVSVYDKSGVGDLAQVLHAHGVEIISTGSTAATIAELGIPVTQVSEVTGFPECLDGRVKTLHPLIHGGILADQRLETHRSQLRELGIKPFDLVVCNLYPFAQTVASGADFDACVEQIDIGGPAMVRAAAKNHASITVVVDPRAYGQLVGEIETGGTTAEFRRNLAAQAFAHTAQYDAQVAQWLAQNLPEKATDSSAMEHPETLKLPEQLQLQAQLKDRLRYGENPHQAAALYSLKGTGEEFGQGIAAAQLLGGKPMSFNNYTDADAALRAAYDHTEPCVAIIKHANPCGIAVGDDIAQAHRKAHACDPVSAFGGVIACNRPVNAELAHQIKPIFTEVVLAPDFSAEALQILQSKKNLRILKVQYSAGDALELKQISGGLLLQSADRVIHSADDFQNWKLVSGDPADASLAADLQFAWRAVRAVKSNAILLVKDQASIGVGMGQVNRVDSCRLAVQRANTLSPEKELRAPGAVAASDAFFPFADGLQILIDAGVRAVVQPGGSVRDEEVIAAAQAAGITMYLTGSRHFFH